VIDSQPGASKPRTPRLVARRLMPRREPAPRRELIENAAWNVRIEREPDTAVTHPLPTRVRPLVNSEPPATSFDTEPQSSSSSPMVLHARSTELSVVAFLSAVVTFGAVLFAQKAAHWGEARAQIDDRVPRQAAEQSERPLTAQAAVSPSWAAKLASNIPVVLVRDLPLEHGGGARAERAERAERVEPERAAPTRVVETERSSVSRAVARQAAPAPAARPARATSAEPGPADRAELARALARAGASARNCGEGPVQAQIVATFAPSGVPSSVHFGAASPPAGLRSCILSAVARSRVTPFIGEPVTVSKNLSW